MTASGNGARTASKQERFRRADPERLEPIRRMSGALRDSGRAKSEGESKTPPSETQDRGSWRAVVDRTVRIGYEIADAQIRKGQEAAEQLSDRIYKKGDPANGDLRNMTETMVRSFGELASGWVNLTTSLLNTAGATGMGTPDAETRNGSRPGTAPAANLTFALEIESRRPTTVTVSASSPADKRSLAARPLRAAEPGKPALIHISFEPAPEGSDVSVRIRVPDEQPAGIYRGEIYDLEAGTVAGRLTVEIRD